MSDARLVDPAWRRALASQFGAAIDMLANAIRAFPAEVWGDRARRPEPWYLAYHTIFWLDLYLHGPVESFRPPAPFGLEELDPAGVLPERVYTQGGLLEYLARCRQKCIATIESLAEERAAQRLRYGWGEATVLELLLYNMRHVQHGAAQLNLILREATDFAPRWVAQARDAAPPGDGRAAGGPGAPA
jgi:hypothetical protein